MSEQKVKLQIIGTQTTPDGEKIEITENYDAFCENTENDEFPYRISFRGENQRGELKIGERRIRLYRLGEINTDMIFSEGEVTDCVYGTPYGDFQIGIHTEKITSRETPGVKDRKKIHAAVYYKLDMDFHSSDKEHELTECRIRIRIEFTE